MKNSIIKRIGMLIQKLTCANLITLSTGGPADFFEIDWSEDNKAWVGGRYVFQDWFDGANRSISAELADLYGAGPEFD